MTLYQPNLLGDIQSITTGTQSLFLVSVLLGWRCVYGALGVVVS